MITYRNQHGYKATDGFSAVLKEAEDYFANQRIQMTGSGFEEILAEASLFNAYKNHLAKGLPASDVEEFDQLMENSREHMLREATVSGIQQIAGLSMPTIRKLWARIALRNAVPTEAVKQPRFSISFTKSYLINSDGTKFELPQAIDALNNTQAELPRLPETSLALPLEKADLFQELGVTYSVAVGDSLDKIFGIKSVKMVPKKANGDPEAAKDVLVDIKADIHQNLYGEVTVTASDNTVTTDQIFGKIDFNAATVSVVSLKGAVTGVTFSARVTQEMNNKGQSISFDVLTRDVNIGVGVHLNAPLPIEWLQDTMAIYNIDGALEVVDLMSQVVAQKLDQEIYNFLTESFLKHGETYSAQFDVRPSAGFAGSPKDWREELKTVIDHVALKMKTDTHFSGGKFVIIGNPLDMQLLPNVDWTFNHSNEEMAGVEVSFNLGAYSGANRYEMVSTELITPNYLTIFYIPGTNRQMTYKYYPYTYNVEKGYRDPNFPNVPSIMMTKRHTLEEFTPLVARIQILNNNASMLAGLPR